MRNKTSGKGLILQNQFCPIYVYVQNRNWFTSALLSVMFHIDNTSTEYIIPPPEFLSLNESKPRYVLPSHSTQSDTFITYSTILSIAIITGAFVIIVGILTKRLLSLCINSPPPSAPQPKTALSQAIQADSSRVEALRRQLRKRRRQRQNKLYRQLREWNNDDDDDYDDDSSSSLSFSFSEDGTVRPKSGRRTGKAVSLTDEGVSFINAGTSSDSNTLDPRIRPQREISKKES